MATLSYTLYDYANQPSELLDAYTVQAFTDVYLTITTNGPFPNDWVLNEAGEWEGGELDGSLDVTIDGVYIGRLFSGPPGDDGSGYFADSTGELPYGTAVIPPDVWRTIIADGQLTVSYELGADAESLARADDYIRVEVSWWEAPSQYSGSPFDDFMMTSGPSLILGLAGNDTIIGDVYNDTINGGDGDDTIDGGDGDDIVRGNEGSDSVSGGKGNDSVQGDAGADILAGGDGLDTVRGGVGSDILSGGIGDDQLWGGDDADQLNGDSGDDRMRGEAGDDTIRGGWGNDFHWGGTGADRFVFAFADGASTERVYDFNRNEGDKLVYIQDFDQVVDDFGLEVDANGTTLTIADTRIVLSGVFDLTVADIVFETAPDPDPPVRTIRGTDGYDELNTYGPAVMYGLGGDDWLTGGEFADTIMGGDGNDQINGKGGDNVLRGGDGNDMIGAENGNDYVSGGNGNDELWSGGGADTIAGGTGNDQLYGGDGTDTLRGNDGIDKLWGGQNDDLLWGGNDRDYLHGEAGSDRLRGEAGNDDLSGGDGEDYLWGGDGDDRLWGGGDTNHLFGGDGADQFMFHYSDTGWQQRIYDFDRAEGDTIVYGPDWDEVVDHIDFRVGKDGTEVRIGSTSIMVSGVFDLTAADITVISDGYWPWEV